MPGDGNPNQAVIAEADVALDSTKVASATQLTFTCHRCSYYGALEFEALKATPPKVKASIRVLGGTTDANAGACPRSM